MVNTDVVIIGAGPTGLFCAHQLGIIGLKCEIAKILTNEGYINGYEIVNDDLNKRLIKLSLKYDKNGKPLIESIRRVSKPSKRVYTKKKDIYKVLNGFGTLILSTSKGILSGKEARIKNLGGEVIGEVY